MEGGERGLGEGRVLRRCYPAQVSAQLEGLRRVEAEEYFPTLRVAQVRALSIILSLPSPIQMFPEGEGQGR